MSSASDSLSSSSDDYSMGGVHNDDILRYLNDFEPHRYPTGAALELGRRGRTPWQTGFAERTRRAYPDEAARADSAGGRLGGGASAVSLGSSQSSPWWEDGKGAVRPHHEQGQQRFYRPESRTSGASDHERRTSPPVPQHASLPTAPVAQRRVLPRLAQTADEERPAPLVPPHATLPATAAAPRRRPFDVMPNGDAPRGRPRDPQYAPFRPSPLARTASHESAKETAERLYSNKTGSRGRLPHVDVHGETVDSPAGPERDSGIEMVPEVEGSSGGIPGHDLMRRGP